MAARLSEKSQFLNSDGKPIVNGKIYIGGQNLDTKLNLLTIYSDRALAVVLANPQILDADGRPTNKIWIPGRYSVVVDDQDNVEEYSDPDAGELAATGTTTLSNILGINAITAETSPAITAYVDGEIYTFKAANTNTATGVTIKVDTAPTISFKINHDQDIRAGQFEQNMIIKGTYNGTDNVMEWTNQNLKTVHWTKGADVPSAGTVTIPTDGNYHDVSGTTDITGINAVAVGTVQKLHFDGILTLTHHATNLVLPGAKNIVTFSGLEIELVEYAVGDFRYLSRNFGEADKAAQEAATERNLVVTPENQNHHISAAKGLVNFDGNPVVLNETDNVSGVVRDNTGLWTVSWDVDFATTNYVVAVIILSGAGSSGFSLRAKAVGSCQVQVFDGANNPFDAAEVMVIAWGRQ